MAETANQFHQAVECLLHNWTALQLAIQHGMGGPESVEKGRWLITAVEQYIIENNGLDVDEIEDFLEDFLNSEFDTIADDGSCREISLKVYNCYKLYREHDNQNLEKFIQQLPKLDLTATKECNNFIAGSSQVKPSVCDSLSEMQVDDTETDTMETAQSVDADGWQTVTKTRTKHRK